MARAAPHPLPRFPLLGEPLALDLVNTRYFHKGRDVDLLPDAEALAEWAVAHSEQIPPSLRIADQSAWVAVLRLRRTIEACIDAVRSGRSVPEPAARALNRAAAAAPIHHELHQVEGRPVRQQRRSGSAARQLAAIIAEATIELLAGGNLASTIRECDGEDCQLLFLAAHRERRWCSSALCGNRARVARHYRRHAQTMSATHLA